MNGNGSIVRGSGTLLYKSIGDQRMTTAFHLYETFPSESHLSPALLIVIQKKRGVHSFVTKALENLRQLSFAHANRAGVVPIVSAVF